MKPRPSQSILIRLVMFTSILLTGIFALTGILIGTTISRSATRSVEAEVVSSFSAYQSLWDEHTGNLARMSNVISRMSDVRAAFLTHDQATIQDTANELWSRVSKGNSLFAIADGAGKIIAAPGRETPFAVNESPSFLNLAAQSFPAQKVGFLRYGRRLLQVIVTPVYVDSDRGQQLIDMMVTGFELDRAFLRSLKEASGGSELIFQIGGQLLASTLEDTSAAQSLGHQCATHAHSNTAKHLQWKGVEYLAISQTLAGFSRGDGGELCIVRSLAASQGLLSTIFWRTLLLYLAALLIAIFCINLLVHRMLRPIAELDRAASRLASGDYSARAECKNDDELGRLAMSFNAMCSSLERARGELIRHERLAAVARLATFVVHDLRNPLASIYAGAEMLVDSELPPKQIQRLARNMYAASRGMMEILGGLLSASRSEPREPELCSLHELVSTAWNSLQEVRRGKQIEFDLQIPEHLELVLDRGPMERVFHNLLENAIEAIRDAGVVRVHSEVTPDNRLVTLHIEDTGHGIHPEVRPILFQPFATEGRAGGMGLGLALSRQTVVAHGGSLSADFEYSGGSHFLLQLPLAG